MIELSEEDTEFRKTFSYVYSVFQKRPFVSNDEFSRIYWFNSILSELVDLGVTDRITTTRHLKSRSAKVHSSKTVIKGLEKVSLSKYLILSINRLYSIQFMIQYPIKESWSHHGVFFLLQNTVNSKIKSHFNYNNSTLDKAVWIDIKRFCNMVFGFVNETGSALAVSDNEFCVNTFKSKASEYFLKYFNRNQIVVMDVDTVLLSTTLKDYKEEHDVSKTLHENSLLVLEGCSDHKTGLDTLNRICRRHFIDIIH